MKKVAIEGFISEAGDFDICWFYQEVEKREEHGILSDEFIFPKEDMDENDINDILCIVELFYSPVDENMTKRKLTRLVDDTNYLDDRVVVYLLWNASVAMEK